MMRYERLSLTEVPLFEMLDNNLGEDGRNITYLLLMRTLNATPGLEEPYHHFRKNDMSSLKFCKVQGSLPWKNGAKELGI